MTAVEEARQSQVAGVSLAGLAGALVYAAAKQRRRLATLGRNRAVAEIGPLHLRGFPAWVVRASAHPTFLDEFQNRALVSTERLFPT